MVLQFDLAGQITFLNAAVEQITGYKATELQRPGFWERSLLDDDDRSRFPMALARTVPAIMPASSFATAVRTGPRRSAIR